MQILIVDDHLAWRNALRVFLNSLDGVEVMAEVADGTAAVKICQVVRPDVVLMDIHMPGLDGYQTAQAILAAQPRIWVVGISSDSSEECRQQAFACGFHGMLSKENVIEELPAILAQLAHSVQNQFTGADTVESLEAEHLHTEMSAT